MFYQPHTCGHTHAVSQLLALTRRHHGSSARPARILHGQWWEASGQPVDEQRPDSAPDRPTSPNTPTPTLPGLRKNTCVGSGWSRVCIANFRLLARSLRRNCPRLLPSRSPRSSRSTRPPATVPQQHLAATACCCPRAGLGATTASHPRYRAFLPRQCWSSPSLPFHQHPVFPPRLPAAAARLHPRG